MTKRVLIRMWMFGLLILLAAPSRAQECVGDCNEDGNVPISELVFLVNIAGGREPVASCTPGVIDVDGNGSADINELVLAVVSSISECGTLPTPTFTPTSAVTNTATPTASPTVEARFAATAAPKRARIARRQQLGATTAPPTARMNAQQVALDPIAIDLMRAVGGTLHSPHLRGNKPSSPPPAGRRVVTRTTTRSSSPATFRSSAR